MFPLHPAPHLFIPAYVRRVGSDHIQACPGGVRNHLERPAYYTVTIVLERVRTMFRLALAFALTCCAATTAWSAPQEATVHLFGRGPHPLVDLQEVDLGVPSPDSVLGFSLGDRAARHSQVLEYFRLLDQASPRVALFTMGVTYEGRELVYAAISTPERLARLTEVQKDLQSLGDPRLLKPSQLDELVARTPACVWLAYSIHGDEISGVDAALGVAYRLAAGVDSLTLKLLDELVILIDPCENPDGRERYLSQVDAYASAVPLADGQSFQKGGAWPWGRGNHYLFDMNRDWFALELLETQARVAAILEWQPHVLVDAHEMGQWDTYLFSPPRQPFNLQITPELREWWNVFAADQGKAFDRYAWPYYTREWNEEWYPGYGSSWPLYHGAVGILYEQAGVSGSRVAQQDGTVLTYSETVAHQYVSSMANLTTAAVHRDELLRHYYGHRQKALQEFGGGPAKAYVVRPDANRDRLNQLALTLERQQIEVFTADKEFSADARSYMKSQSASVTFPQGTLIIPTDQPTGYLIQTILGFDWRMPDSFLVAERRELLKHRDSKLYEVTGWSLLQAYGVDAYSLDKPVEVARTRWVKPGVAGGVRGADPAVGFGLDMSSDRSLSALVQLFERGLTVEAAIKDLDAGGVMLPRGSLVIPKRANRDNYVAVLDSIAGSTGVEFVALESGRGALGPDLGGNDVQLLRAPRVALAAAIPSDVSMVGSIWHLLDYKLGLPVSLLEIARLGDMDLSIYNVLILPDTWGPLSAVAGPGAVENIKTFVRAGGTLIALEGSAAFCADSANGLSTVRLRHHVLGRLAEYEEAARLETTWETPDIAKLKIWDYPTSDSAKPAEPKPSGNPDVLKRQDEAARVFSPHGAVLRVTLDTEDWLTSGMKADVPALIYTSNVFLAKYPEARTVARFADTADLRISGLLWPEARERLALSSYCTREQLGSGQVILFAGQPNFRAYYRGTERLLVNAVLYGPGLGTRWMPKW